MINNYLFRLLFDYRGIITRREYLAGLAVVLLCFMADGLLGAQGNLLFAEIYNSGNISNIRSYPAYMSALSSAFYFGIPYTCAALYICLNITIKRFRTINISISKAILTGLLSYLIIPCLCAIFQLYSLLAGNTLHIEEMKDNMSAYILLAVFIVFIVSGVISIIYTSSRNYEIYYKSVEKGFGTIRCLFSMAKLILCSIFITGALLVTVILTSSNLDDIEWSNFFYIIPFLFALTHFIILIYRGKDAGIKTSVIISLFSAFIILYSGLLCIIKYVSTLALISAACHLIINFLLSVYLAATFVLIALPGKKTKEHTEKIAED